MTQEETNKKDPNVYPPGMSAQDVRDIIDYHEKLIENDSDHEIEALFSRSRYSLVQVPTALLAEVERLVDQYEEATAVVDMPKLLLPEVRRLIGEYEKRRRHAF